MLPPTFTCMSKEEARVGEGCQKSLSDTHKERDKYPMNRPLFDTFSNNVLFLPETTNQMFGLQC